MAQAKSHETLLDDDAVKAPEPKLTSELDLALQQFEQTAVVMKLCFECLRELSTQVQ